MKFYLLILSILSANLLSAQNGFEEKSDPNAIDILKSISDTYKAGKTHLIEFKLDIELPGQAIESQQGTLVQADDKFVLKMEERTIISNNETVWMYLNEMNEVQINDADFDEDSEFMSPSDLFELYDSEAFIFAIVNEENVGGTQMVMIEAKPVDEDSDYSKMRLAITKQSQAVKSLKIFNKDGSRFTMHINQIQSNYPVNEKTFMFNAEDYEGVQIEDLRF